MAKDRRMTFLFVVVAFVALGVMLTSISELNRTAIYNGVGSTTQGYKFSVGIGSDRREAMTKLSSHKSIKLSETFTGTTCLTRKYQSEKTFDIFVDSSRRRGTICLISDGKSVEEIAWYFGGP